VNPRYCEVPRQRETIEISQNIRPAAAASQQFPQNEGTPQPLRRKDSWETRGTLGDSRECPLLPGDSSETRGRLGGAARNTPRTLGNARRLHGDTGWPRTLPGDSAERSTQKDSLETRDHPETLRDSGLPGDSLETPACGLPRKTPWRLGTTPRLSETRGCPETPWRLRRTSLEKTPGTLGERETLRGHSEEEDSRKTPRRLRMSPSLRGVSGCPGVSI
jgi:hypothetical protein